jgi:hypothetical protein
MEPLDLSERAPRGPREMLDGLFFMPRTIDKIRATLPGGHIGPYHVCPGLSQMLLDIIGVTLEDLTAVVAEAKDDEAVAKWLRSHADVSEYERANRTLSELRDEDVPPSHRARFESLYPAHLRKLHKVNFDLIEADDRELFGSRRFLDAHLAMVAP